MKKFVFLVAALTSFSLIAGSALPDNRHISITGSASLTAKPDIAVIELNVESIKETSLAAKQSVDLKVNEFLKRMPKFEISSKNVSASNIVTEPNVEYSENDEPIVKGYVASRTLKVSLSQLAHLNDLLNFALQVGLNEIEDITLKSSLSSSLKKKAKKLAIEDAKNRAAEMAEAFGSRLGKIYSINETRNTSDYSYRYGSNEGIERIEVTGSKIKNADLIPGRYLEAEITFDESVKVVFDLEVD